MVTDAENTWIDAAQRAGEARRLPHTDARVVWWNPLTWLSFASWRPVLADHSPDEIVRHCRDITRMNDTKDRSLEYSSLCDEESVSALCRAVTSLAAVRDTNITDIEVLSLQRDRARSDLKRVEWDIVELRRQLKSAEERGAIPIGRFTDDGVWVTRGDRVYLGTAPEDILFVVDSREAIDRESGVCFQFDEAVAVFSKRENARAWKRAQRNPTSPTAGAGTVSGAADQRPEGGTSGTAAPGSTDAAETTPAVGESIFVTAGTDGGLNR